MYSSVNKVRRELGRCVERAVVSQVLRDDHEQRWPRTELERKLADIEQDVLDEAIAGLTATGVVNTQDGAVWASDATRRLDELELIDV
jgi:DNA-binding HxlR family transcriptional regulator